MNRNRIISSLLIAIAILTVSSRIAFANLLVPASLPLDIMYHGSANPNISMIEPRAEHVRDPTEGSVVFASPSIAFASCYLFRWNESWAHQSVSWKNDIAQYEVSMVISDRRKFLKSDLGGAIYLLPRAGFAYDDKKGLGIFEWTRRNKTAPFAKLKFYSALEAMKMFGVKIYFLSKKEFNYYINLPDHERKRYLSRFKPS